MRYNKIRKTDISDGPGIRVSIFFQGCPFHCEGCFNSETWDFNLGKEFSDETINTIISLCDNPHYKGLSILGGEPLCPTNIEAVKELCKKFRSKFDNTKTIWLWTGYHYEDKKQELANIDIDVLVDGQFILKLKDTTLPYCGSKNQRVIDLVKTKQTGDIVLYNENLCSSNS